MDIYKAWANCLPDLVPTYKVVQIFDGLMGRYRKVLATPYHNIDHVKQVINDLEELCEDRTYFNELLLAAFYHDVIYTPYRKDNEVKSVEKLQKDLGEYLSDDSMDLLEDIIISTKHHRNILKGGEPHYDEARIYAVDVFLDADLAILGAEPAAYEVYRKGIQKEYSFDISSGLIGNPNKNFVKPEKYLEGRMKFLDSMLSKCPIYVTDSFRDKYEQRANCNIIREIKLIEDGKLLEELYESNLPYSSLKKLLDKRGGV